MALLRPGVRRHGRGYLPLGDHGRHRDDTENIGLRNTVLRHFDERMARKAPPLSRIKIRNALTWSGLSGSFTSLTVTSFAEMSTNDQPDAPNPQSRRFVTGLSSLPSCLRPQSFTFLTMSPMTLSIPRLAERYLVVEAHRCQFVGTNAQTSPCLDARAGLHTCDDRGSALFDAEDSLHLAPLSIHRRPGRAVR